MGRPLLARLGRVLVIIGLGITLAGAAGLWATILAEGTAVSVWALAAATGSAVVTTVYFSQRTQYGAGHAMTVSVAVVGAIALLCLGLVWLLPASAPEEQH